MKPIHAPEVMVINCDYLIYLSSEKVKPMDQQEDAAQSISSPLMHIEGFFEALTNTNIDGRIVINKQGEIVTVIIYESSAALQYGLIPMHQGMYQLDTL